MITGPGNVYVAAAKRVLQGVVGIDAEDGPTEIAILADHTADPAFVAADLIGQAEHDALAACLLVTTDPALPGRVDARARAPGRRHQAPRAGRDRARQPGRLRPRRRPRRGPRGLDAWAPEHLEIQTDDAAKSRPSIRNAGAIFVGPYSPVSLGDYLAGSNHVLPTGGTARHTGGLSVYPFLKASTSSSTTATPWPPSRRTSTRSAAPRTWPPTSPPSASACRRPGGEPGDREPP